MNYIGKVFLSFTFIVIVFDSLNLMSNLYRRAHLTNGSGVETWISQYDE